MIHAKKARGESTIIRSSYIFISGFFFNVEKYHYHKTDISGRYVQFIQETLNNTGKLNKVRGKARVFPKHETDLIFTRNYLSKSILLLVSSLQRAALKAMMAKYFTKITPMLLVVRFYPTDD